MQRGYSGVAGRPVKPYVEFSIYENSDCWLNLTFLDRQNNLATPVSITYRIDELTTDNLVLATTSIVPTGPKMSINIPAALNCILTDIGQTSQINQVAVVATFADGSLNQSVHVYEVIAVQTVGGQYA